MPFRNWRGAAAGAGGVSNEDDWSRARRKAQQRSSGSSPPGAIPVGNFAALGAGLLGAAWYTGYFEAAVSKPDRMLKWLEDRNISVVVFELDYTMSAASSSDGLPKHELEDFMEKVSEDFVVAARVLAKQGFKLAVATHGDAARQQLPGSNRDQYLLGPDLARLLLQRRCPEALPSFGIIVGHDPELHRGAVTAPPDERRGRFGFGAKREASSQAPVLAPVPREEVGKRHHMRKIAQHYQVEFKQMVLFDFSKEALENEDGWTGVQVSDKRFGFQFDDCLSV